ncbi:unnamed protein product [Gordionus sp. m RMFG-2023]|uniref:uncharacterized protein LOC135928604 n=1 Tax=Gordionus sp. m RMFG-2023 TaxID=3053472 RepID=UPI0030E4E4B0
MVSIQYKIVVFYIITASLFFDPISTSYSGFDCYTDPCPQPCSPSQPCPAPSQPCPDSQPCPSAPDPQTGWHYNSEGAHQDILQETSPIVNKDETAQQDILQETLPIVNKDETAQQDILQETSPIVNKDETAQKFGESCKKNCLIDGSLRKSCFRLCMKYMYLQSQL